MAVAATEMMLALAASNVEDRGLCASDLLVFTKRMFPSYSVAEHHKQIALRLQSVANGEIDRLIITVPPRHGKSELASIHFPAWYLANNPDNRIIACSNTQTLADRFSRQARNKTMQPQWPFPDVHIAPDLGQVQRWDISGHRGGYIAAGIGGSITGFGGDLILIDDPVKSSAEADSPTYRESTWEWYQGTLRTRLEPGGAIVVIGTRWHEDDLIGRLLNTGDDWELLHLPAIGDDGKELWPETEIKIGEKTKTVGYSLANLQRIRRDTGTRNFEALYQGRPQPAEGGMFKRHWWRYWKERNTHLAPVAIKRPDAPTEYIEPVEIPMVWDRSAQSWDMTFKDTKDGSFVVGLVGKVSGTSLYITDYYRQRSTFTETINALETMTHRNPDVDAKLIEEKANGAAVIDTLKHSIAGLIPVQTDGSKEARAHAATPYVEAGNVYLPHPSLAPWVEDFIAELASFPTGKYDDQVDTASQLIRYLLGQNAGDPSGVLDDWLARR